MGRSVTSLSTVTPFPKRLFVAIELPEVVGAELVRLGTCIPGVRWHPPEKLHLTLAFLGDAVPTVVQQRLRAILPAVQSSPFFLPVAGAGSFGGERPRALWIGTGPSQPELFALHRAVQDATLAAWAQADMKAFVPHITLAYAGRDTAAEPVRRWVRENAGFDAGRMRVEGFALFSSVGGTLHARTNRALAERDLATKSTEVTGRL